MTHRRGHRAPGAEAPLHVHHREDEALLDPRGRASPSRSATRTIDGAPGRLRLRPARHPAPLHGRRRAAAGCCSSCTPGGFEDLVSDMSVPAAEPHAAARRPTASPIGSRGRGDRAGARLRAARVTRGDRPLVGPRATPDRRRRHRATAPAGSRRQPASQPGVLRRRRRRPPPRRSPRVDRARPRDGGRRGGAPPPALGEGLGALAPRPRAPARLRRNVTGARVAGPSHLNGQNVELNP